MIDIIEHQLAILGKGLLIFAVLVAGIITISSIAIAANTLDHWHTSSTRSRYFVVVWLCVIVLGLVYVAGLVWEMAK